MSIKMPRAAIAVALASTLFFAGCSDDSDKDKNDSKQDSSETSNPDSGDDGDGGDPAVSESGDSGDGDIAPLEKDNFYQTVIEAQIEAGSYKGTTTSTVAGQSVVMNMEASYEDGKLSSRASSDPSSAQQIETILVDGVVYMKGAGLGAPEGKWLKIDTKDSSGANNPLSSLLSLADPENAIKLLDDPKEFKLIGAEDVDGVGANHYQITLDSATYAKNLNLPEIASALPPELTFDMWVDAENRPVKMHQEIEVSGQSSTTDVLYTDYGTDVNIEAPPAADTVSR